MTSGRDDQLPDDGPIEAPATWENELVGRAEQALGKVTGSEQLADEGEETAEVAHEVREKYREQRHHDS